MKKTVITTIIFDLGGVLVKLRDPQNYIDYLTLHQAKMNQVMVEYPKIVDDLSCGKISLQDLFTSLSSQFGMNASFPDFQSAFNTLMIGEEIPGMYEMILDLKRNYKVVLLSNTNLSHIEYTKKTTRLLQPMDRLFFSYEMGIQKPDPQIYLRLLQEMAVPPEETLFIDDMEENTIAASDLGMNTINAKHNISSAGLIKAQLEIGKH